MAAIVFIHSADAFRKYGPVSLAENAVMVQAFKFGTIGFFIISGFLVGDRLPASDPLGYLRRRAHRLVPAWALWFGLWVLYTTGRDLLETHGTGIRLDVVASMVEKNSINCLTWTPLWFIPNFLVALTCVVMLRRWLNDLRLGAVLLAVNIFYGVNVYTRWLPSRHTEALFGFVFYLWLGAWCAGRKQGIQDWACARSPWWLSFWACVAAGIAIWEITVLAAHNSPDPLNSLRFGNQLYSVLIVILLVRIRRRTWPSFINVAETTYGVYLIHAVVMIVVFSAAMKILLVHGHDLGPAGVLLIWALLAPTVYFLSLQLTRSLAGSQRWGWAVGASNFSLRKFISPATSEDAPLRQPAEA